MSMLVSNDVGISGSKHKNEYYVDPVALRNEIRIYKQNKEQDKNCTLHEELAVMVMKIAIRFTSRPCHSGYSFRQDFIMEATEKMCKAVDKIDPDDPRSPFSYLTQTCFRSVIQYIKKEKRHEQGKQIVKEHIYNELSQIYGLQDKHNPNLDQEQSDDQVIDQPTEKDELDADI